MYSQNEKAIMARVNRRLRKEGQVVRKSRLRWMNDLGQYYIVGDPSNYVEATNVDLQELAQELNVA